MKSQSVEGLLPMLVVFVFLLALSLLGDYQQPALVVLLIVAVVFKYVMGGKITISKGVEND